MTTETDARQVKGTTSAQKSAIAKDPTQGIYNEHIMEGFPQYLAAPGEKVISGENNTWIVLGRDRPSGLESGKGGAGETHCGTVSIVVGRHGVKASSVNDRGQKLWANPDIVKDAATLYISQTTDVDKNFGLTAGQIGESKSKSAIAMKADDLRLVARQGIKLTTGTDTKNSRDQKVEGNYGVDLIGGNDDGDMQPMVKGKNLVKALEEFNTEVKKLNGILIGFIKYQSQFNIATMFHHHITMFPLMPTLPPIHSWSQMISEYINMQTRSVRSLATQKYRLSIWKQHYLQPYGKKAGSDNRTYINSPWHSLN